MDADSILYVSPVLATSQGISIAALLWNFYCYYQLPQLSMGLKLIFVLGMSDFIMHIALFTLIWPVPHVANEVLSNIFNIALRFSIGWTTNIAILVYISVIKDKTSGVEKCLRYILVILVVASIIPVIISYCIPNIDSLLFSVSMALPLFLCLLITMFCYLRSIFLLKRAYGATDKEVELKIKNLYRYAFLQLVTIAPSLIYCTIDLSFNIRSREADTVTGVLLGLAGFANAMVYFFQRRGTVMPKSNDVLISDDPDLNNSQRLSF